MNATEKALVLKVQSVGDNNRVCTLLTENMGVIRAFAYGAQSMKNRNFAATTQFACGEYVLKTSKDSWTIAESSVDEVFVSLRNDIVRLAAAQYLCDLACEFAPQDNSSAEYLQLMKTALYLLANSDRSADIIKAASEMRMLSIAGYMPDLVMCEGCGAYESKIMYFSPRTGTIRCSECGGRADSVALGRGAMAALRHTVFVEPERLYAFALEQQSTSQLAQAAEKYLLEHTERSYSTLDFYKSLQNMQ